MHLIVNTKNKQVKVVFQFRK